MQPLLPQILIDLYQRDLDKLSQEINAYQDQEKMWMTVPGISNSAGNLCLHILGNLNHFIGAVLGNTGYERAREAEFAQKNLPSAEMGKMISETSEIIRATISKMDRQDFHQDYPAKSPYQGQSTGYFLAHLLTHLNYHLGQINYHRRILEG
ncbi:MAG: DinB family protein [Candidatus Cyclobacteriaceae bacterium M3_2C_046]